MCASLGNNYGQEQTIDLKATITAELRRFAYLKFSLAGMSEVNSAKLRIYGRNHEGNTTVRVSLAGIDNDSWTETGINGSNAPTGPATALGTFNVMKNEQFFEVDITDFAKAQLAQDKTLTLMLSDLFTTNKRVTFNSRENALNPPTLLITTSVPVVTAARIAQAELSAKPEYEVGSSVVYPNPVNTKFTIQVGSRHQRSINLSLISNAGRVHPISLPESLDAGTKAEIDISSMHLPTGIYLLKVQSDSASEILKVLLAK
jgi:hypothetical protein